MGKTIKSYVLDIRLELPIKQVEDVKYTVSYTSLNLTAEVKSKEISSI